MWKTEGHGDFFSSFPPFFPSFFVSDFALGWVGEETVYTDNVIYHQLKYSPNEIFIHRPSGKKKKVSSCSCET